MGYTHYWERPKVLPRRLFARAAEDCRRLCQALAIPLGDAQGNGSPTFQRTQICFNGHVHSGQCCSIPSVAGLIWPGTGSHGVARVGQAQLIAGGWGAGPVVTARVLGPHGDGSYETFSVECIRQPRHAQDSPPGGWGSNACKTNYRPYDLCVQGCLLVLSQHLGSKRFRISSDGSSADWNEARDACQHVLGYGIDWGEGDLAPVPPLSPPPLPPPPVSPPRAA